eukprot:228507_1
MISFKQDTSETIILHAILNGSAVVVNLVMLVLLIYHFKSKPIQYTSLKVLSFASISTSLLVPATQWIAANNATLPSLHHLIHLIDDHCSTLHIVFAVLVSVSRFSIWLFLLCKIKVFFGATPFKLSSRTFYSHIIAYSILSAAIIYAMIMHFNPSIYIGSTGTSHKLCFISPNTAITDTYLSIIFLTFHDGCLIEMVLLYLLYSKSKRLTAYQANNEHVSPYFSQRDKALIDDKLIKQSCIGVIVSLLARYICAVCFIRYDMIYMIAVALAFAALPVVCSFDIKLNVCRTMNDVVNEDEKQSQMIQRREQYLTKIMNGYYNVPQRTALHQDRHSFHSL